MSDISSDENKFMMPAEWEEHSATWLAWPNDDDYFAERKSAVEKVYLKIISALHKNETVKLLVLSADEEKRVQKMLEDAGINLTNIIFFQTEYVDVWVRDYGPTYVKNSEGMTWVKWYYDCYNGKFPELTNDDKVFSNLQKKVGFPVREAGLAMEGGAIDTNGRGTILTTRECLIKNRNHGVTKEDTENILKEMVGAKNIIWLNQGLVNDHTDGHIDEVARFVSPNKILCSYEDDASYENHARLKENFEILENSLDQDGHKFEIIKLPMPHMYYDDNEKQQGKQAPVSYANFYMANKTVLVSLFNDEHDGEALAIIKSCFPDREVVGIDCRDLIYGGGAIHCITQQEPKL